MRNSSENSAQSFLNVVIVDRENGCKATLGGAAILGNEKRPSASLENKAWRFVMNAKANAARRDLDEGECQVLLDPEELTKVLKAQGLVIALEVRDARPAPQEGNEDDGDQW